jgi:hypothetical protein
VIAGLALLAWPLLLAVGYWAVLHRRDRAKAQRLTQAAKECALIAGGLIGLVLMLLSVIAGVSLLIAAAMGR